MESRKGGKSKSKRSSLTFDIQLGLAQIVDESILSQEVLHVARPLRILRIEFAGAVYHLTSGRHARQHIYHGEQDHGAFLEYRRKGDQKIEGM